MSKLKTKDKKKKPKKPKLASLKSEKDLDGLISRIGLRPVGKGTDLPAATNNDDDNFSMAADRISLPIQLDYARNGHAVVRNVLNPKILVQIRKEIIDLMAEEELKAWKQKVQVASNPPELAASCETIQDCQEQLKILGITASLPFLQFFNTWRTLPLVKNLAYSLGEAASIIMDVPTVRLYQDAVFWKRINDGPTPWHADARMAPFDTSHMITFWIPLVDVPVDGTALLFCSKSHADIALPYWNPLAEEGHDKPSEWGRLEHRYPKQIVDYMPMAVGDMTVHSGWTLHCANGNVLENEKEESSRDRIALAISFVDAKAELRADMFDDEGMGDNEDRWSYQDWASTIKPRKQFRHELVPIVWPLKR